MGSSSDGEKHSMSSMGKNETLLAKKSSVFKPDTGVLSGQRAQLMWARHAQLVAFTVALIGATSTEFAGHEETSRELALPHGKKKSSGGKKKKKKKKKKS